MKSLCVELRLNKKAREHFAEDVPTFSHILISKIDFTLVFQYFTTIIMNAYILMEIICCLLFTQTMNLQKGKFQTYYELLPMIILLSTH